MLEDDFNQEQKNKPTLFGIRFGGRKEWHYTDKNLSTKDMMEAELAEEMENRSTYLMPLIALGVVMQVFGSFAESVGMRVFSLVLGTSFFMAGCFLYAKRSARIADLRAKLRALESKTHS